MKEKRPEGLGFCHARTLMGLSSIHKQNGSSQTELSRKIEVSREAIGKFERNEALPSVETAKKIADAFGVIK